MDDEDKKKSGGRRKQRRNEKKDYFGFVVESSVDEFLVGEVSCGGLVKIFEQTILILCTHVRRGRALVSFGAKTKMKQKKEKKNKK